MQSGQEKVKSTGPQGTPVGVRRPEARAPVPGDTRHCRNPGKVRNFTFFEDRR